MQEFIFDRFICRVTILYKYNQLSMICYDPILLSSLWNIIAQFFTHQAIVFILRQPQCVKSASSKVLYGPWQVMQVTGVEQYKSATRPRGPGCENRSWEYMLLPTCCIKQYWFKGLWGNGLLCYAMQPRPMQCSPIFTHYIFPEILTLVTQEIDLEVRYRVSDLSAVLCWCCLVCSIISYRWISGKLWYLQHKCVGDTIVYH